MASSCLSVVSFIIRHTRTIHETLYWRHATYAALVIFKYLPSLLRLYDVPKLGGKENHFIGV